MFSKKSHKEARYPCKSSAGKTNVKVSRNLLLTIASMKTPIIKDNYTFKEGLTLPIPSGSAPAWKNFPIVSVGRIKGFVNIED